MANLNTRWAQAILQELFASGVRHAVVCPGSRSAPLALACRQQEGLKTWSIVDERTAGFFALGIALRTGAPAAVVTTSGTAGAHLYPAVIEAAASNVPLIVLTADRPWELHGFGALQTVDQQQLFGRFPRGFVDLAAPEPSDLAFHQLRSQVARAAALAARARPRGPVHLNVPFREPLAPSAGDAEPTLGELARSGRGQLPFLDLELPRWSPGPGLEIAAGLVAHHERGVILCGPRWQRDGLPAALQALSHASGYPILAEAASGIRFAGAPVVSTYDLLLRDERFAKAHRPEVVLSFGQGLTSKALGAWLDEAGAQTVLFSDDGALFDPTHRAQKVICGDPVQAAQQLAKASARGAGAWASGFQAADELAQKALGARFGDQGRLTEPQVAARTLQTLPDGSTLVVASSMPIRDVDAFGMPDGRRRHVLTNRGVNGIDGTLSTALGAAAAADERVTVLTGDLAYLHDLNGLLIARRHGLRMTVVVVNNDGGGIFSFLPIANIPAHFEELFATPHGLDFAHASALFGARHHRVETAEGLDQALRAAAQEPLAIIEACVERGKNVPEHQAIVRQVQQALQEAAVR